MFKLLTNQDIKMTEALLELQKFAHTAFIQKTIDSVCDDLFNPSVKTKESMIDLLVLLKQSKLSGAYQPHSAEVVVLKKIFNSGYIKKQVPNDFFAFNFVTVK